MDSTLAAIALLIELTNVVRIFTLYDHTYSLSAQSLATGVMLTRAASRAARAELQQQTASACLSTGAATAKAELAVKHDTDGCELFIEMPNCGEHASSSAAGPLRWSTGYSE